MTVAIGSNIGNGDQRKPISHIMSNEDYNIYETNVGGLAPILPDHVDHGKIAKSQGLSLPFP